MTVRTVCLLVAAGLCTAVVVKYFQTPMRPGDPEAMRVLGWCMLGSVAAYFCATWARKGAMGLGLGIAGLAAGYGLIYLGSLLTPGSFLGLLIAIGILLLVPIVWFFSAGTAFVRIEMGQREGDSVRYLSEMLISFAFFEVAWCLLVAAFSWT